MTQLGIFTTDANLVVRTWDEWLERITSRSAAEVCGKCVTEIFPDLESRRVLSSFHRVLQEGVVELLSSAFHRFLFDCPPQSPSRYFQHMQQRTVIAPLREEMEITGLVVTIEDVTARREREMEMASVLSTEDWQVRRKAVDEMVHDEERTPVAELIRRLRGEHRDPSVLNAMLQLLVSGAWEAFEPLLEVATDDDAELRMYSALALGDLKDRRAIPALLELLKDRDTNVRYHAIEALAKLKAVEAVDELTNIAESSEFFLAFPALDALSVIGEPRIAPRLVPLLESETLRGAAAAALAKLGDESIVAPIVLLLEHPALVAVVVEALGTLHDRYETTYGEGEYVADLVRHHVTRRAARNLLGAMNNAGTNTLRLIVRVLGWIRNAEVIHELTHFLGSSKIRSDVIESLVRYGRQVIEPLCLELESGDSDTRRAAIVALARIGDPKSVPALLRVLQDPELTIDAAGALARIGDARAYESLLGLLSHDRAAVRQAAIGALNSLGDRRMAGDIGRLLVHPNPHLRESAVRIAGYFGYPNCGSLLLERVHDRDENVRRAAVETLANLQDERVLPVLLQACRDNSPRIRIAAIQSLGYIEAMATLPHLLSGLGDHDSWVRYYAARALGQLRSPEAIDALTDAVRNDSATHVRIAAAEALGSIGGRRVVSILAPLVDSEDRDLARCSLMALGTVGHPDAVQPILTILRSDGRLRFDAVHAIAVRRNSEAVDALQWTAATDADPKVFAAAIDELCTMGTPESISALVQLTADRRLREHAIAALGRVQAAHIDSVASGLRSNQIDVRRAVIEALGRMKHPAASKVLSTALDDKQPEVRTAAILALRRLGSQTSEKKLVLMAHADPDTGVRKAAERALERYRGQE
jgi:HEAT repeat protein